MKRVKKLHTARGPWLNFPNTDCYKSPEVVFTKRFINIYRREFEGEGVGIREFSVQGLGIADFLWIEKNNKAPRILAFELKLKNWQKGMMQAYRYSFFSDESYLVVPDKTAGIILDRLDHFREMNIGLIGFEEDTHRFTVYQLPEKKCYASHTARSRALKNLVSNYNLGFLAKYSNSLSQGL